MKFVRTDRVKQLVLLALLLLSLLFVTEVVWERTFLPLHFIALPAAGLLMGYLNSEIKSHILLHSIHLITLFVILLLAIYASELGGTAGVLFFLCAFPPAFYVGLKQKTAG